MPVPTGANFFSCDQMLRFGANRFHLPARMEHRGAKVGKGRRAETARISWFQIESSPAPGDRNKNSVSVLLCVLRVLCVQIRANAPRWPFSTARCKRSEVIPGSDAASACSLDEVQSEKSVLSVLIQARTPRASQRGSG